jgi:hypothetical protein
MLLSDGPELIETPAETFGASCQSRLWRKNAHDGETELHGPAELLIDKPGLEGVRLQPVSLAGTPPLPSVSGLLDARRGHDTLGDAFLKDYIC